MDNAKQSAMIVDLDLGSRFLTIPFCDSHDRYTCALHFEFPHPAMKLLQRCWLAIPVVSVLAISYAEQVEVRSSCPSSSRREMIVEAVARGDLEALGDDQLRPCINSLLARGSHRCWHKHSTFHDHLLSVHNILKVWGQDETTCRVGLFHSAYSNSYVNLALYDVDKDRETMRNLIGEEAEAIVYIFCIIDRQQVVVNTLLRQGFIPPDGLDVPHLKNANETVHISSKVLHLLVIFTMADIADQYFGWQDELFGGGGDRGSMIIPHKDDSRQHQTKALWPGSAKPGLWMSYLSQLGEILNKESAEAIPPVFGGCTEPLSLADEEAARDLYWSVITETAPDTIEALLESHRRNPYAFEPLLLLAQTALHDNNFEAAEQYAEEALHLAHLWGTPYDKRWGLSASIAWARVLLQRAQDRLAWPTNAWDINNLGLVR